MSDTMSDEDTPSEGYSNLRAGRSTRKQRDPTKPRLPTPTLLRYSTSHYTLYDPTIHKNRCTAFERFSSYDQYDGYLLYSNPNLHDIKQIPRGGVRLDDMAIAAVLMKCNVKKLRFGWPGDFDHKGLPRATRVSLGLAAKFWKKEGDVDMNGHVLTKAEEGYYDKWWRNVHCLCGKEGLDPGMYLIRPSEQTLGPKSFGFKVSSRAVIQREEGDVEGEGAEETEEEEGEDEEKGGEGEEPEPLFLEQEEGKVEEAEEGEESE